MCRSALRQRRTRTRRKFTSKNTGQCNRQMDSDFHWSCRVTEGAAGLAERCACVIQTYTTSLCTATTSSKIDTSERESKIVKQAKYPALSLSLVTQMRQPPPAKLASHRPDKAKQSSHRTHELIYWCMHVSPSLLHCGKHLDISHLKYTSLPTTGRCNRQI